MSVCAEISKGRLVKEVCRDLKVADSSIREWVGEDRELGALYARARENQAHAIAEQALAIADGSDEESETRLAAMVEAIASADDEDKQRLLDSLAATAVQRDRLRVDARKWLASKIAPRSYGDRQEIVGADGGPVTVNVVYSRE